MEAASCGEFRAVNFTQCSVVGIDCVVGDQAAIGINNMADMNRSAGRLATPVDFT
jgi:hypothetical protein